KAKRGRRRAGPAGTDRALGTDPIASGCGVGSRRSRDDGCGRHNARRDSWLLTVEVGMSSSAPSTPDEHQTAVKKWSAFDELKEWNSQAGRIATLTGLFAGLLTLSNFKSILTPDLSSTASTMFQFVDQIVVGLAAMFGWISVVFLSLATLFA